MKAAFLLCAALFVAVARTGANDGFGSIGASGLEFSQTDKVAMVSEDLFINLDKIKVAYVFANTPDEDVSGEVAPPATGPAAGSFLFGHESPGRPRPGKFRQLHCRGRRTARR